MEPLTEQRVREIVREEIAEHRKRVQARRLYEQDKHEKFLSSLDGIIHDDLGDSH